MSYLSLSASAQAAYANLASASRMATLHRTAADLPGGFTKKVIAGHSYWYFQNKSPDGKPVQIFVGPEDAATRDLIAKHADPVQQAAQAHLQQLSRAADALGCSTVIPKHARVLRRLADHGFFQAGGILIGTHAFLSYQNMLGVQWQSGANTLDIDFAHPGRNVELALPPTVELDTKAAIESLSMGFVPTVSQTTYKKADEPDFDLDFVTSMGKSAEPVFVKSLNISLQPLRFMEFSMEDTTVAVLLTSQGPIVTNVPRPERYAVHKLIIHGERPQMMLTKSNKDIEQAASLLEYFFSNGDEAIDAAWNDAVGRGPGWKKRAIAGAEQVAKRHPELGADLSRLIDGYSTASKPTRPKERSG